MAMKIGETNFEIGYFCAQQSLVREVHIGAGHHRSGGPP
jgi:hypothetical protein